MLASFVLSESCGFRRLRRHCVAFVRSVGFLEVTRQRNFSQLSVDHLAALVVATTQKQAEAKHAPAERSTPEPPIESTSTSIPDSQSNDQVGEMCDDSSVTDIYMKPPSKHTFVFERRSSQAKRARTTKTSAVPTWTSVLQSAIASHNPFASRSAIFRR